MSEDDSKDAQEDQEKKKLTEDAQFSQSEVPDAEKDKEKSQTGSDK